jgi:hypothetical protein
MGSLVSSAFILLYYDNYIILYYQILRSFTIADIIHVQLHAFLRVHRNSLNIYRTRNVYNKGCREEFNISFPPQKYFPEILRFSKLRRLIANVPKLSNVPPQEYQETLISDNWS